jgi:UDP-2,3-diacylglucosamine pyrophosphatase LpxH
MLIIISDIHLGDGTCGKSISASAFRLFADRLKELALNASRWSDGTYHPIGQIDILLMGDILDPLHSTLWLEKSLGEPGYVRPWTDTNAPELAATLKHITRDILQHNIESVEILRGLSEKGDLKLPPVAHSGLPDLGVPPSEPVMIRLHYMVGNHDWYYHLPGPDFDVIRQEIIQAIGLSNPPGPFPHELRESEELLTLLDGYRIFAQHGDLYDPFNYSQEKGRDYSSLGDAFAVEVINRFPQAVEQQFYGDLSPVILESLHQLVNVRPALATPLWIGSQLRQNSINPVVQEKLKTLWDEVCDEFLALPMVRAENKPFKLDIVDGLELAIHLTDRFSFKTIDDIVVWARRKFHPEEVTYARHALNEEAFLDHAAQFIVYGHTHHHEIVPLDSFPGSPRPTNQIYMNSGTWHTYYDLATHNPSEQKFISYQVLTYLTFFKEKERRGRRFETWSGTFSD